jgi:hypothetical protein
VLHDAEAGHPWQALLELAERLAITLAQGIEEATADSDQQGA